ncbi:ABC transporter [Exiguobacterium sp. KRL4]|uniref:ABC transporter ATP-binding protein n=1 Tax=Exiguobacterium sp. KRL4 TaxID=1914536 RepID=UPI0008F93927|nr:ABC transporter ATP-binding protein [Exiguobacterium sp. KRL4]OIN68192.1 ABC transporter [Exiguobacterium sp. KRL4]
MDVTIQHVNKTFGQTKVLHEIDLTIPSGRCVALIGPSGSGKTTLLRLIAGLEKVSSGSIHFGATEVTRVAPNQRGVTMLFQRPLLFPHLTVGQNVRLGMQAGHKQEVEQWLDRVGLTGRADAFVHELSGGEQQRASLARALASQPNFLLLDEPFSSLDLPRRRELRTLIRRLTEAQGVTTLFVTHDREEAMAMADYVYVMEQGHIIDQGKPVQLAEKSPFFGDGVHLNGEWYPLSEVKLVLRPTNDLQERVTITKELIQYGVRFYEVERDTEERLVVQTTETFEETMTAYIVRKEG